MASKLPEPLNEDESAVTAEDETPLGIILQHLRDRTGKYHSPFKWHVLARWEDDNPFVGYRAPLLSLTDYDETGFYDLATQMYKDIGGDPTAALQCKPADDIEMTIRTNIASVFPAYLKNDLSGYTDRTSGGQSGKGTASGTASGTSLEVSKQLAGLLAQPANGISIGINPEHKKASHELEFVDIERARKSGAALAARALLLSHEQLIRCVPVRFNLPRTSISAGDYHGYYMSPDPTSYALWMTFRGGEQTILPLALSLIGGRSVPYTTVQGDRSKARREEVASGWTWDSDILGGPLKELFNGCPLLQMTDCQYSKHANPGLMAAHIRDMDAIQFKSSMFNYGMIRAILNKGYHYQQGLPFAKQRAKLLDELHFDEANALIVQWSSAKVDTESVGRILWNVDKVVATREETRIR